MGATVRMTAQIIVTKETERQVRMRHEKKQPKVEMGRGLTFPEGEERTAVKCFLCRRCCEVAVP